jgi:hypothetical protein
MTRHFEKPEQIVAKALEAKALMSDIVEILVGNADEHRRFVSNTPMTIHDPIHGRKRAACRV